MNSVTKGTPFEIIDYKQISEELILVLLLYSIELIDEKKRTTICTHQFGSDLIQEKLIIPSAFCFETLPLVLVRNIVEKQIGYQVFDI